jgi:hypothetical protein
MAQTPYTKLTTAQLNTLASTTLGNLYPYQLAQVQDALSRLHYERGSTSDVGTQPTISAIVTALGSNNP